MDEYRLAPTATDSESLAGYAKLLTAVFPDAKKYSHDFVRWQYVDNPDGAVVGYDAFSSEGELAAHYVTLPIRATLCGSEFRGLLSLNTATAPRHQGKGLFTKLATATYERGASEGFAFVVGVANANSTPGFLRKLGFSLISRLDARLGLGSPSLGSAGEAEFSRAWSDRALSWRLANPSAAYTTKGALVFAQAHPSGVRAVLSTRLGIEPARPSGQALSLLPAVWIGLRPKLRWPLSGSVPLRFRPSPLNLIFKPLQADIHVPQAVSSWFEAIDFDAY